MSMYPIFALSCTVWFILKINPVTYSIIFALTIHRPKCSFDLIHRRQRTFVYIYFVKYNFRRAVHYLTIGPSGVIRTYFDLA